MIYRAEPVTQRDGSQLANSNCLMAAAAVGLDFHTLGAKTSTGAKMRDHSGDTSGGTNTDEILRAWDQGYQEIAHDRDGRSFDELLDDLWAGRLVMIQVWHATVGGPCLSGSGQYGHGLSIAPEQRVVADGSRQWLVADPWCKPASWVWIDQSKLKAGAEEWVQHSASGAVSGRGRWPDPRDIPIALLIDAARLLMTRYNAGNPGPVKETPPPLGAGGPVPILFAATKPHEDAKGADDVVISLAPGADTDRVIDVQDGADYYRDALRTERLGHFTARTLVFMGTATGTGSRAVKWKTAAPYDDGKARDSIVYVDAGQAGDPYAPDTKLAPQGDTTDAPDGAGGSASSSRRRRSR